MALIEAGADRSKNLAAYGKPDAFDLAAAYAFGIAKARGFIDGNKRTAFVAAVSFLRLNGHALRPEPIDGVRMMQDLAASEIPEMVFAAWMRGGATPNRCPSLPRPSADRASPRVPGPLG